MKPAISRTVLSRNINVKLNEIFHIFCCPREQLNLREKMCNDITIQRKRALMALEKLQVHFTEEMAAEGAEDVQELGRVLDQDLAGLAAEMKAQAVVLDTSLGQLDTYQQVNRYFIYNIKVAPFFFFCKPLIKLNSVFPSVRPYVPLSSRSPIHQSTGKDSKE